MPGHYCVVPNCKNNYGNAPGLHYYVFPKDIERANAWALKINRPDLISKNIASYKRICSIHFEDKMFQSRYKLKLLPIAVPTLALQTESSAEEVHFTDDQELADGKKKLKLNAVPQVFAENKECTKENIPHVESDRNPMPSDANANSSSLLKKNRCEIFEEVNIVGDSPNLKDESDEKDLGNTKYASQDNKRSHNSIYGKYSEEQYAQPFDLTEACRVCFGKIQLENIFIATYQENTLHNLLEICSSIKINKNTKFKQICVRCKSQLIENYTFIKKIITSNNSLQLIELNNKRSFHSRSKNEIEEIFIFIDKRKKPTEIYSEKLQQDLGNSLVKFEENVNNNQGSDTVKTESNKIKKINEEALKKTNNFQNLQPTQNEFSVNDENNISQYYLIKAEENTIEYSTHKESIFQVPEKEVTKILRSQINLTETNTSLDPERSELAAVKTPGQNIVYLQDHTYVDKCRKKLSSSSKDKISFLCEKCGLSLKSKPNLRTHIKRVHDGIKKLYRCQKCNIFCRSQASYETHRSQHVGKYHCCETCGKMFAGMAHLSQHLSRHSTLRPYACGVCSKSFRANYLLQYHVATHLKERKYVCHICNEPFLKMSDLRSHIKKTHPKKLRPKFFTCDICDYKGLKKRTLQIHLKKIHNLVVKDSPEVIVIA